MRRVVLLACATLLAALWPWPCRADDGAITSVGGAVCPLSEHPTIRLTHEYVHVWFRRDEMQVECVFFLENEGPATTVTIGFPNFSSGADVEENVPFQSFASYVDGDSVAVTILPDAVRKSYGSYGCWYTKTVPFDAGQRRCVRNTYSGGVGNSPPDYAWFEYILWTGGTWLGPIGVADIVVSFESLALPMASLEIEPAGYHTSPGEIRWHFVNLEPGSGSGTDRIRVSWRGRLQ